jgi:hypothetical protein
MFGGIPREELLTLPHKPQGVLQWVVSAIACWRQLSRLLALRSVSVVDYFRIAHNLGIIVKLMTWYAPARKPPLDNRLSNHSRDSE